MCRIILLALVFAWVLSPVAAERVAYVIDGDTIKLADGRRVRYIGIDTPEMARDGVPEQPGAREAAAVNRKLIGRREVRLEYDAERHDHYGRDLAYVWVGGTMVNAELVRRGYAVVMPSGANRKYAARLEQLEQEARAARRGLWGGSALREPEGKRALLLLLVGTAILLAALWLRLARPRGAQGDSIPRIDGDVRRAQRRARKPMRRPGRPGAS